jgi:hypothetical protein
MSRKTRCDSRFAAGGSTDATNQLQRLKHGVPSVFTELYLLAAYYERLAEFAESSGSLGVFPRR